MALLSKKDGAFNPEQAGMTSLASGYFKMKGDGRVETGKLVDALGSGKALFIPDWFDEIRIDEEIGIATDKVILRGSGRKCPIKQMTPGIMAIRLDGDGARLSNLFFKNPKVPERTDIISGFGYLSDAPYSRPAGVMATGSGNVFTDLEFEDMVVGIRLRGKNRKADICEANVVSRVIVRGHLFGILFTNQKRLLIEALRGYDTNVRASTAPPHAIYGTASSAFPEDESGSDIDEPDEPPATAPYDTRNSFVILRDIVDYNNRYSSSIKTRGIDGLIVDGATLEKVTRGFDVGYCQHFQIINPQVLLTPGYSYEADPEDQTPNTDSAQSGINVAASRDGSVKGGTVWNETGHDLAIAAFIRDGCSRVDVIGTESRIAYTSGAGDRAPFMSSFATDCNFIEVKARDSGAASVQIPIRVYNGTRVGVIRPRISRANAVDVPVVYVHSNSVDTYVELHPKSLPAGVTVDGAVLDLGRGTRREQTIAGVPRVPVWFLHDPTDRTAPTEKILLDGSVPGGKVYTNGTRWKFASDDANVQSISFSLQPVNTLVGSIVNVTVATVNVAVVQFQLYDAANVAVGSPRYVNVVTSDDYATGVASYNRQAEGPGTGYYVKATAYPGSTPSANSDPFDTATDTGDIWIPSDLTTATLAFAFDANDPASAYVSGGLVTELRHLYDATKKITAALPQTLLASGEGRDGTKKAVQFLGGNYGDGSALAAVLAAADTSDIQTGNWCIVIGHRATSGVRIHAGWWVSGAGTRPRINFRQGGGNGWQVLLRGASGGTQTVGPSPAIADDALYHVDVIRKVGNSIKIFHDAFDPATPYASATITATGAFNPDIFLLAAGADSGTIAASATNGMTALLVLAGNPSDTELSYAARWVGRKTGMVIPPL